MTTIAMSEKEESSEGKKKKKEDNKVLNNTKIFAKTAKTGTVEGFYSPA